MTRYEGNAILQVCLGFRGAWVTLTWQSQSTKMIFFPHLAKNYYSAASLKIFARINGIISLSHSYTCCLLRIVFNFFPPP